MDSRRDHAGRWLADYERDGRRFDERQRRNNRVVWRAVALAFIAFAAFAAVVAACRASSPDDEARASWAWAMAKPPRIVERYVTTYRQPQGHSHTCPHDGTTWDHVSNPGHNCPRCGFQQLHKDVPARMITVRIRVFQTQEE